MNRYSIIRITSVVIVILAAVFLRLNGLLNQAYAITLISIITIPISSLNLVINKEHSNPLPGIKTLHERYIMMALMMILLLLLSVLLITGTDIYTGAGICIGVIIMIPIQIRNFKKQAGKINSGIVLWDERDMIIAGKAAKTVINFQILLLGLGYIALMVFPIGDKYQSFPTIACIGMLLAVTACGYFLLYAILRKRNSN